MQMKSSELFNIRLAANNFGLKALFVLVIIVVGACGDVSDSESSPTVGPTATARPQAEIVSESKSSVVRVETTTSYGDFTGSGFILSGNSTVIATAYHVVEDADAIWIRLGDEGDSTKIAAELIAFDEFTDLALLRVIDLGGGIELSDSSLDAGKSVLALGFPLGLLGSVSVSQGIISRRVEFEGDFFVQHDAEILQGNSGGPLLDDSGRVIGINILVIPDGVITSAGLNFAVHVGELIQLMQSVGIESSIVAAIPTATPVPTPTFTPAQVDAAATAVIRLREIDTTSATSTVLARALDATIEVESTAVARALATKEVEVAATVQAEALASIASTQANVVQATATVEAQALDSVATVEAAAVQATATAGAERVARLATVEAVAEYCQVHSGELMLGPISDSMTNKDGLTGYYDPRGAVNSTDFVATITFTNPHRDYWDYGLIFRKNNEIGVNAGYGEAIEFSPYGITHYSLRKSRWDSVHSSQRTAFTGVGARNEIELHVLGTYATLVINGFVLQNRWGDGDEYLNLGIPSADQLIITPFAGWLGENNVGTVDFENFSVSCS